MRISGDKTWGYGLPVNWNITDSEELRAPLPLGLPLNVLWFQVGLKLGLEMK